MRRVVADMGAKGCTTNQCKQALTLLGMKPGKLSIAKLAKWQIQYAVLSADITALHADIRLRRLMRH